VYVRTYVRTCVQYIYRHTSASDTSVDVSYLK